MIAWKAQKERSLGTNLTDVLIVVWYKDRQDRLAHGMNRPNREAARARLHHKNKTKARDDENMKHLFCSLFQEPITGLLSFLIIADSCSHFLSAQDGIAKRTFYKRFFTCCRCFWDMC